MDALVQTVDPDEAYFVASDLAGASPIAGPRARSARVESWDGRVAVVAHDGACDLVVTRAHDAGWLARVNDGPERPVLPVDGGLQAVRLTGSGPSRVSFRYAPRWLVPGACVSAAAVAGALVVLAAGGRRRGGSSADDAVLSAGS
jgi:hypothetical protein